MLKKIVAPFITVLIAAGCKQKTVIQQPRAKVNTLRNNFFPVTQYLLGQLNELDSLPVTPLKVVSVNKRLDSTWIKKQELRSFVLPFITTIIDSARLYKYFSEKSFLDQTINAFTFAYDPIAILPDSIEVKRWVVYVDPVDNHVKRVYIMKQQTGASKTMHLTWKSGYYCQITTITEKDNEAPEIREEKLIWNFKE